ncbi:response regulator transcription factor [Aurantimicrobium minutum]|uniref:Regulatory protein n=1 Tax=Aurantimicrobium minutum TaxID=708131 RepID=A0A173LVN2_9MICO|nr:response regulator transcription factor [Aurantimicrobium minutum]BAU98601.1 regulatory protein [Aurantimicrobium minutum]
MQTNGGRRAPATLAILDDHGLLVESITSWFSENAPDFDVVCSETSWAGCLGNPAFPADMVLMDYQLAENVSIEARVLTCKAAGAKVVVISALGGTELEERINASGADEYFDKATSMRVIAASMRQLLGMPAMHVGTPGEPIQHAEELSKPRLSAGEEQALMLYCQGLATKDVAEAMNVQFETAKTYLRRVREKYARAGRPASRRADLVRRAAEDGYLT